MDSIIRVATASGCVFPFEEEKTAKSIVSILQRVRSKNPDIILFPLNALSQKDLGSFEKEALKASEKALTIVSEATKSLDSLVALGALREAKGKVFCCCALLFKGEVLGFVPPYGKDEKLFCDDSSFLSRDGVFSVGEKGFSFSVLNCQKEERGFFLPEIKKRTNCDLVLLPSASPFKADEFKGERELLLSLSSSLGISIALSNSSVGETSSPYLFESQLGIFENGKILSWQKSTLEQGFLVCDVDRDIINSAPKASFPMGEKRKVLFKMPAKGKGDTLLRRVRTTEFVPSSRHEREKLFSELSLAQSYALSVRLKNTGIKKLVIGVSGGLDSALALLVCKKSTEALGLSGENILAVTMPAKASSNRTYQNSLKLISALGLSHKNIPIEKACLAHLEEIGWKETDKSACFENAFARERTKILFDLANMENALVVGTGDLSESALGFCTYGGDQLSSYNVNISVPKSLMRSMVSFISKTTSNKPLGEVLRDILETPISPELLGSGDKISQKTEEIVGPYELVDFFLYYLVKYKMSPEKILFYSKKAFEGTYSESYLKERLRDFLNRFFSSQFKRSCSPDGAILLSPSLSPREFYLPSDLKNPWKEF